VVNLRQNRGTKMSSLSEISIFLDRYKDFSKRLERQKIAHYKAKFGGLLSGYYSLRKVITVFNQKEAFNYNIFEILNIKTAEVKTHTPFLKNLLNPNGSHGQSDLFLNSFIQNFIPQNKRDFFMLSDIDDYLIEQEKPILKGRIDIYIQSLNPKNKFGIIIENKLHAEDQKLQLNRYYDFINGRKYGDHQMIMFYLTIDGSDPSNYSIDMNLLAELKRRNIFYNLSYRTDIYNWLHVVLNSIKADKLKYLVEQYLEIIKHL
jgi:hypothetical protein